MNDERSATLIDRRLGQRLRARRLEIGMSQERLAELLGVTFQQVQKYEKGVNRVAASRLFEVATALDVPVGYFFENVLNAAGQGVREDEPRTASAFDMLASPEGMQLMSLFASIESARLRRRVVDLVRALVEEASEKET